MVSDVKIEDPRPCLWHDAQEIIGSLENSNLLQTKKTENKIKFLTFEFNIHLFQPNIKNIDTLNACGTELNIVEVSESLLITENKSVQSDYELDIHWELIKWFGRRKFIVFTPFKSTSIYGQDQVNQLISSITIASANIKCQLPIIIKYGPKNWPLYVGIHFENDFKNLLQCAIIKYTPRQCMNLAGIRRIFQEKLGLGSILNDDVTITAKYLYEIDNCHHKNEYYFTGLIMPVKNKMHFFQFMSIGFAIDPIKNTKIYVHWSKVSKQILMHSNYQSLPVTSANSWYIICESENTSHGILYKTLRKLLKSFLITQRSNEILKEIKSQEIDTLHINQPLMKLTKFPISNHHLFEKSFGNSSNPGQPSHSGESNTNEFLDRKMLQDILLFIFPDASLNKTSIQEPYLINDNLDIPHFKKLQKRYPNANKSFLIHRLAICLTNLLSYHKEGMKCFSYIWMEVVLELRYRLEKGIPLPDTRMGETFKLLENGKVDNKDEIYARLLENSIPQLGSTQLEQRLQLINYCILTRLRNQSLQEFDNISTPDSSDSDEFTEQFFDCETDNDNCEILTNSMTNIIQEPRGRLRKFGDLTLINKPDVPIYVPITQVLSVDVYSNWKQTKHDLSLQFLESYHAASLIADMSAFKAANPGCIIEDFIRWYSPKDFIESENCNKSLEIKGELSTRMLVKNNAWQKNWESAKSVPARLQKRLFDDTIAAETALKWMQNLTIADISSSLINNVLIDSLNALVECIDEQDPPEFLRQINSAAEELIKFFDSTDIMDITGSELEFYQNYDDLISHFQRIEYFLTIRKSLYYKFLRDFSGIDEDRKQIVDLINQLLITTNEIQISKQLQSNSAYVYMLDRITSIYEANNSNDCQISQNVDQIFAKPSKNEYVLSVSCSYPFPGSRKSNQRLYVSSGDDEFSIATNLCEDLTYF